MYLLVPNIDEAELIIGSIIKWALEERPSNGDIRLIVSERINTCVG